MMAEPLQQLHTTPLEAAKAYASLGWHVFPVNGKRPATANGLKDATTDFDQIEAWWPEGTSHGVAIRTGPESGLWVLDIDVTATKNGVATLQRMTDEHGQLPPTCKVRTGTGAHFYYDWDPGHEITNGSATPIRDTWGEGLDIRGAGGYVVAPPSNHPAGGAYYWAPSPWDQDPAEAPQWLYEATTPQDQGTGEPVGGVVVDFPTGRPTPTIGDGVDTIAWWKDQHDWEQLLNDAGWTHHSSKPNGDTWWTRPGKNRRDGHSAVLHPNGVLVVFTTEIDINFRGIGTPTRDGSGLSLNKFDWLTVTDHGGNRSDAGKAARTEWLAAHPGQLLAPTQHPVTGVIDEPEPGETEIDHRQRIKSEFDSTFVDATDIFDLPPPKPLIGTWVDEGAIVIMPGPFGSGKTHLLFQMALSVASGLPWLGQPVHKTGPTWFFAGEGVYTLQDRARAWLHVNQQTELPSGFKAFPKAFHLDKPESWVGLRWRTEDLIADGIEPPTLIIFDTWSRYTSGAEIPEITKPAAEAIEAIRDLTQAAIAIPTHTGHNVTGRSRGDSTLEDNADIVIPILSPLRDRNTGKAVAAQLANTKQKARATNQPIWVKLTEIPDPEATNLEPGKTLAWVDPTAEPDDDGRDSQREIIARLTDFVRRYPGQFTAYQIERGDDAAYECKDIGTVRTRKEALAMLLRQQVFIHSSEGRNRLEIGRATNTASEVPEEGGF